MKISSIQVSQVSVPLRRAFWMSLEPYTTASELIVQIRTDDGLTGIGQIHGRPMDQIAAIVVATFALLLIGEDPMDHERHWSAMFAHTHTRAGVGLGQAEGQPHFGAGARPQIMAAIAGIDIALWDLMGKICGQPVSKLLGASRPTVRAAQAAATTGPRGTATPRALWMRCEAMWSWAFGRSR